MPCYILSYWLTGGKRRMVKLPFATSDRLIWGNGPWSHFGREDRLFTASLWPWLTDWLLWGNGPWAHFGRTGYLLPLCVSWDDQSHSLIDPSTNSEAGRYIGCVSGGRSIAPTFRWFIDRRIYWRRASSWLCLQGMRRDTCYIQCCGSWAGRIRNFFPDSDPVKIIPDPGSPEPEWIWKKTYLIKFTISQPNAQYKKIFNKIPLKALNYKILSLY